MKFETNELYYVKFYDHCAGAEDLVVAEVCGWVIKNTDKSIALTWWNLPEESDEVKRSNKEPVAIAKSTIISKRKITIR